MIDFLAENYFNLDERVLCYLLLKDPNVIANKQVSKLLRLTQKSCSNRISKIKQLIKIYAELKIIDRSKLADELLINYSREDLKLLFFIEVRLTRKNITKNLKIASSTVAQRFTRINQKANVLQLMETIRYLANLKKLFYLRRCRKYCNQLIKI